MARMKKTEVKRVPKKQEWAAPLMTEKEKQMVRSLMDKRVQKLEAKYGKITMQHVKELVATRSLQMPLQKSNRQPSDVAWAWVAEQLNTIGWIISTHILSVKELSVVHVAASL